MSRLPVSPKPLTGGKVLAMLIAFFGVVIGVNMIMMRLAIQTMPGTDVDSAADAIFLIFRGLNEYAASTPAATDYDATVAGLKRLLRGQLFT